MNAILVRFPELLRRFGGYATLAVCLLLVGFALPASAASVTTDKDDYPPGATAIITGTGWASGEEVTLQVVHADDGAAHGEDHEPWTVTADASGNFTTTWHVCEDDCIGETLLLTASGLISGTATATFTDAAAADLDHGGNGSASAPISPVDFGDGNLNQNQAHFVEGHSVPYRAVLTDLPLNTNITLTIGFDIKHSSRHALDYLTHFNRLQLHGFPTHSTPETIDPLDGIAGAPTTFSTFTIPTPSSTGSPVAGQPTASFTALPAAEKLMTLYGGFISNVAYVNQGNLAAAQSEAQIIVSFAVTNPTAILAWGGHIASRIDWGVDGGGVPRSAGGINGSPYHMRFIDFSLKNVGQQDHQLAADAVLAPPTCIESGPIAVCGGSTNTYSVTVEPTNSTVSWSLVTNTSGAMIIGSTTGPSVDVSSGTSGAYTVRVIVTANGFSSTCHVAVAVSPGPTCSISLTTAPVTAGDTETFSGPAGMTTYAWTVSYNGGTPSSVGGNSQTVNISIPLITGTVTVGLTVTSNGCSSTCSQTYTINPPAGCIASLNPGTCPGTLQTNQLGVTASPGSTILWTFDPPSSCASIFGPNNQTNVVVTSATCCSFTLKVTITETNNGPMTMCTTMGAFVDSTPPMITCPPNATVECTGDTSPVGTGSATGSDTCGPVTITFSDGPMSDLCGNTGSFIRTWKATDDCGNMTTCPQTITVVDTTPPTVVSCPMDETIECPEEPQFGTPQFSDTCDSDLTVTSVDSELTATCPTVRKVKRTWTATDDCGNSIECSQTITVKDTTAPTISCPDDVLCVKTDGDCTNPDPAMTGRATATDLCDGVIVPTYKDDVSGSCPVITITRTWRAVDACNNAVTCVQVITCCCQPSLVTDTSRCTLLPTSCSTSDSFRLLFTPDVANPGCYKLNASNPGQFYYNVFFSDITKVGMQVTFNVTIPYPFVTQGNNPVEVYDFFESTTPSPGQTCLRPGNKILAGSQKVFLADHSPQAMGGSAQLATVTVTVPPTGIIFLAIHLDYGLKGFGGYDKLANVNGGDDAVTCGTTTVVIPNMQTYNFSVGGAITDGATAVSCNRFKKNPGVGGRGGSSLTSYGVPGAAVVLKNSKGATVVTGVTDEDGWYMLNYKHTGKEAIFNVTLTPPGGRPKTQSVTLKANKFAECNFTIP